MKKLMILVILFFPFLSSYSQVHQGDNLLGGSIGLRTNGNSPVLGISFESHIYESTAGTIGIGGLFRFHTYNDDFSNGDERSYNFTSLGFQSNYNFNKIGGGKFVPFLGLTLGYNNVSNSYISRNGTVITSAAYSSGVWIWGQIGARYFFTNSLAGSLRFGIGNNNFYPLELGLDFKL